MRNTCNTNKYRIANTEFLNSFGEEKKGQEEEKMLPKNK